MTKREFHGEEFYLWMLKDYENLRAYRNSIAKRRPTEEEVLILQCNKPFEQAYRKML